MSPPVLRKLRCAVYTRKSSEEGLDMAFNSLDAQREACEAYVASQRPEGWVLVPDRYDDGGISGGTLERPALKRLLADVEAGLVDVVVVYKIDRLSRSLTDFAKLVELFERHQVTFVSVTQQFSTTTSMGRLTLNVLLSFAQFEREVIGERIRDKVAASRARGIFMGGMPPLGYDVRDRKLVINETEAALVRRIFRRFVQLGSATAVTRELRRDGCRSKSWTTVQGRRREGVPLHKSHVYRILANRVYIGEAVHKGVSHKGEHEAIVERAVWDEAQAALGESPRSRANGSRGQVPALLKGLIFAASGCAMTPTHTRRRARLYRYYVAADLLKDRGNDCPVRRVPAGEIEAAVLGQLRGLLRAPEIVVRTWRAAREHDPEVGEAEVRDALDRFDGLWDELFPAEQARIVHLLVERIEVGADGLSIRLRTEGLATLVADLRSRPEAERRAA